MTTVQRVAQIFGWVFVLIAVWGFFISRGSMEADPAMAPRVMGLFPVNLLHNLVYLAFGVWGIAAARSFTTAKSYAQIAGVIYLVLTVLGLIMPTTLGLMPIGSHNVWLHALIGIVLAGVGFSARPADEAVAATGPQVEPGGARSTTASSPEGTVTRPPAEPTRPPAHDRPVPPETAGSSGAAPAAPPPPPPDRTVDRPPTQPERPGTPPPPPGGPGDRRP